MIHEEIILRIKELTKTMDIPDFRRGDVAWLSRNMAVRNIDHENLVEVLKLIKEFNRKE
jgi:hypothetical protein